MNRIDRLTAIILLLQGGRRTASEIARRFEVSKRTTFRDIQALCEIGVPIVTESGAHGGYTLMPDYSLAPLQLTQREALLLRLALGSISQLADAPSGAYRASSASSAISLFHNARRSAGICRSVLSVTMVAMSRPLSARHAAALFGSRTQSASRSNQNAGRAPVDHRRNGAPCPRLPEDCAFRRQRTDQLCNQLMPVATDPSSLILDARRSMR